MTVVHTAIGRYSGGIIKAAISGVADEDFPACVRKPHSKDWRAGSGS